MTKQHVDLILSQGICYGGIVGLALLWLWVIVIAIRDREFSDDAQGWAFMAAFFTAFALALLAWLWYTGLPTSLPAQ